MEDAIKEMRRAIRNYILESSYDEMDEDARIEKFWQDLGDDFFSNEAIENFLCDKTASAIERYMNQKDRVLKIFQEVRDKRIQERKEMGDEAFLKKFPLLTYEEKRDKLIQLLNYKRKAL